MGLLDEHPNDPFEDFAQICIYTNIVVIIVMEWVEGRQYTKYCVIYSQIYL